MSYVRNSSDFVKSLRVGGFTDEEKVDYDVEAVLQNVRRALEFDETYIVVYNRYAEETGSQGDTRLIARVVSVLRGTHGLDARWKNDEDGEPYVCVHDIDGWAKLNGVRK